MNESNTDRDDFEHGHLVSEQDGDDYALEANGAGAALLLLLAIGFGFALGWLWAVIV